MRGRPAVRGNRRLTWCSQTAGISLSEAVQQSTMSCDDHLSIVILCACLYRKQTGTKYYVDEEVGINKFSERLRVYHNLLQKQN